MGDESERSRSEESAINEAWTEACRAGRELPPSIAKTSILLAASPPTLLRRTISSPSTLFTLLCPVTHPRNEKAATCPRMRL